MRRASVAPAVLIAFLALIALGSAASAGPADGLTFTKDIAPLVWQHCGSCHRPGALAPFSLLDYSDVANHARQVVNAIRNHTMPPWLPEPGYSQFANERRLQPEEVERIEQWVAQGMPRGDAADLPARPQWTEGWQLGKPDLVVEARESYGLRPGGADVFRNFVVPIPIPAARYVRGVEVNPGNQRVVHHVSISVDRTRASRRLDDADPEPGFSGSMMSEGARSPGSRALGWTPGMRPSMEPDGMAWRLEKDTDLVISVHMIPSSSAEPQAVRPSVAFYFTDTPPARTSMDFKLGSKTIDIPAGAADYAIEDAYTLPVDVDVLSVYPHAHYLAKEMKAFATLPDGTVKGLIWIKHWDFHWQDEYRFATPVSLPARTVVTMRYTYDNSVGNRHNPQRPPKRVVFGPQSSDEMGDLWLRLLPRRDADLAALARSYRGNELRKDIAAGERMVAQQPREGRWRNALGVSYLEAGDVQAATAQLEEALRLAPGDAEAHNNLGHALQLQDKVTEAIPHFREAVRLAPENDLVHLNLANALEDVGELDDAILHFQHAIRLNPILADAHNNLGIALGAKGMLDEAILQFRQALEIRPDYADAQKNLTLALELLGSRR